MMWTRATILAIATFFLFKCSNQSAALFQDKTTDALLVVAEGAGPSADEALRDAFRNAVRQVVGAVVDAETLVQSDDVISDRVLTYSDGFIKKYDEIPKSKSVKNGVHRVRIKALVEQRNVVAKLASEKVMVREVDGKSLFAEAVTQLDAESSSADLLTKCMNGFPADCIVSSVMGKPVILEKNADLAKIKVDLSIRVDEAAFKNQSKRLCNLLDKIATPCGNFTCKFEPPLGPERKPLDFFIAPEREAADTFRKYMQSNLGKGTREQQSILVAVSTASAGNGRTVTYRYYRIDRNLGEYMLEVARRSVKCTAELVDSQGNTITAEDATLRTAVPTNNQQFFVGSPISLFARFGSYSHFVEAGLVGTQRLTSLDGDFPPSELIFLVSPVFYSSNPNADAITAEQLSHKTTLTPSVTFQLTLDELKRVKDAKITLSND